MLVRAGLAEVTRPLCYVKSAAVGALPSLPSVCVAARGTITSAQNCALRTKRCFSAGRFQKTIAQAAEEEHAKHVPRSAGLKSLKRGAKAHKAKQSCDAPNDRYIFGQSSESPIRARFAPSPTGYLHLGSLRTALFNTLAAQASGQGAFILRIEDTDQSRLVDDAEERLLQDLRWAGLKWDEGPDCGGPFGPYRQSERLSTYATHVDILIKEGHAYRCFCSNEKLESQKRELHEAGKPTIYPGTCRSIDPRESNLRAGNNEQFVVRLKGDKFGRPKFRDAIYGPFQKKDTEEDFVLLKTDGFPTYHLANVVDDHLMMITHVIRGEEWLISTPKHLALYEAFGWEPPTFAHLGLLVNADGTKLSKRNDSVNLAKYRDARIFPIALLTWLANLGSSFKSHIKTPRSITDISDALTFKFTRGGIKLNREKLDHFQSKYCDAMLWEPAPGSADSEAGLVYDYITAPMLREIDAITNGDSEAQKQLPPMWRIPLDATPIIASDDNTSRAAYVRRIFAGSKTNGFLSKEKIINQHPYLLWRVPLDVYKQSIAKTTPDKRVISAIRAAVEDDSLWSGDDASSVMNAIWISIRDENIDHIIVHNVMRLIGAGGQDVVSQSSSRMISLLGKDEWNYRLAIIDELLEAK